MMTQQSQTSGDARVVTGEVVLVTGASGFIGSAVIEKLAGRYRLVGLDRPGPPDPPPPADAVGIDLGSDEAVRAALETVRERYGTKIASVVHLAAYYDVSGEPNPLYDKITVQGTRRLIEGLQSFEVEQFIFASTMLVHKPTDSPDERIREDSPIEPTWAYPESKVRTEELLRERHGNIPIVLLRIAGVYDDTGHSVFLAQQISRVYERQLASHVYPGPLCAGQSFLHIDDLTEAVARLIHARRELPSELPLLVGEPEALGYAEMQDIIGRALHGTEWKTYRIPQAVAEAGAWVESEVLGEGGFIRPWMVDASDDHYPLDIGRARALLGWEPEHALRDALPKMAAALKRDPTGWYKENKLNPALVAWYGVRPAPQGQHADKTARGHEDTTPSSTARLPKSASDHAVHAASHQDHHGSMAEDGDSHRGHMMDHESHMAVMARDERKTRWAHFANIGLGAWLAASPLVYDAATSEAVSAAVRTVTADRGLPSVEWRMDALMLSDVASGLAVMLFGLLSLDKRTAWFGQWANVAVGLWLLFAPLLFWTPSAAQYLNDMIVGAGVIAFAVLVPMMPGMSMAGMMDMKSVPPGWTYSPSTDAQRFPIVAMGLIGLLISRHLTAYQLGHIDQVWEPFFMGSAADPRNGTAEIITSMFPKPGPSRTPGWARSVTCSRS